MMAAGPARPVAASRLPWLQRTFDVRAEERTALVWSCVYAFSLFLAYYLLRPLRDELGVAGGVHNLSWLFSATLSALLVLNPLFAYAVKTWSRARFIVIAYRFFTLHLLAFAVLFGLAAPWLAVWLGRAFFVWTSVFNLFVVSVFWSFIADVYDAEQGKRLFGYLAAGATLGGIAGSSMAPPLMVLGGQNALLLLASALLELAVLASRKLAGANAAFGRSPTDEQDPGAAMGGLFAGISHILRSPYLLGVAGFTLIYAITSTLLYFHQASIAEASLPDRAARTAFFADIDFWVNVIALGCQLLLTGRLMAWLGVAATLCVLPLISVAGFMALASTPSVTGFVVLQVARRVSNFALARPARELLFIRLPRQQRYQVKTFIDTVVYRGGDQIGGWVYTGLLAAGLASGGIALVAIPISLAWLALGAWLGRRHGQRP